MKTTICVISICFASFSSDYLCAQELITRTGRTTYTEVQSIEIKSERAKKIETNSSIKFDGSYQFLLVDGLKPLLTRDIIAFVEDNRKEDDDVNVFYSERIRIFIPSKASLESDDFIPLNIYK